MSFPHPRVTLGVPAAAIFSFLFVSISDEKEFSLLGSKVSGLAGKVVLWLLLFFSIVFSINFLW
jgi:hypothetical protein